ncbi:MAG: NAD-dependent epimerase/dehydratase family protein [Propionibacteriales bacterium]|nr:NAD-dependent epimerase/dehydratase family protein [Propionibacteriales bacterium]
MRVVVTGGAGFIGANLARVMVDLGLEVVVVDDLSTGSRANLDGVDARFLEGSVLEPDLLDEALTDADAVVHLAALPSVPRSVADPLASHHANATGTLQVLEAVRRAGGPYLVVASSSSVYGANPTMPKHEGMRTAPLSPYAVSKLATEAYTLAYAHCYGLDVLAFRFFNVFGPLQRADHAYAAVVPAFVDAALSGRPIPLHGDGTQTRDFTYVGSVARVITEAVRRRVVSADPVNLAYGGRTSLLGLIDLLEAIVGHPLARASLPPRAGDVPHSQADRQRLSTLFPALEPVPLERGLEETVRWFAQAHQTSLV